MINYFVIKVFIFFIMIMVSDKKVGGLLYFYSLSISVSVSLSLSLFFTHTHTHTRIWEKYVMGCSSQNNKDFRTQLFQIQEKYAHLKSYYVFMHFVLIRFFYTQYAIPYPLAHLPHKENQKKREKGKKIELILAAQIPPTWTLNQKSLILKN